MVQITTLSILTGDQQVNLLPEIFNLIMYQFNKIDGLQEPNSINRPSPRQISNEIGTRLFNDLQLRSLINVGFG